jgi:hypothetical protein
MRRELLGVLGLISLPLLFLGAVSMPLFHLLSCNTIGAHTVSLPACLCAQVGEEHEEPGKHEVRKWQRAVCNGREGTHFPT